MNPSAQVGEDYHRTELISNNPRRSHQPEKLPFLGFSSRLCIFALNL